jgi:hypothetical protein
MTCKAALQRVRRGIEREVEEVEEVERPEKKAAG